MQTRTLHEIEHEAWSQRAAFYDDVFAGISTQAIAPVLNALGDLRGKHLLDVACGTGHLVAAAAKRGAISQGVDFAQPMVAVASTNYPTQRFQIADAANLTFEDASFDAVCCSFGLSHMEFPQAAVAEAFRVLRAGGRFAFTLWCGPDDGGEFFAIGRDALAACATVPFTLPSAWTQMRHADQQTCERIVKQAGFSAPQFQRLPIAVQTASAQTMLNLTDKIAVRSQLILESQPAAVQQNIRDYMLAEIEARRVDGVITLAWPALLTVAQKPE
ncbi:MAG: class I SAM-dependent methyltransferase [Anaerolineae bacterium]|nr:class I SAM-dependent methyltransferase [Anaerolineae bacterium]